MFDSVSFYDRTFFPARGWWHRCCPYPPRSRRRQAGAGPACETGGSRTFAPRSSPRSGSTGVPPVVLESLWLGWLCSQMTQAGSRWGCGGGEAHHLACRAGAAGRSARLQGPAAAARIPEVVGHQGSCTHDTHHCHTTATAAERGEGPRDDRQGTQAAGAPCGLGGS